MDTACDHYMYDSTYTNIVSLYKKFVNDHKEISGSFNLEPIPRNEICKLIKKTECGWTLVMLAANKLLSHPTFLTSYNYLNSQMKKKYGVTLNLVFYMLLALNYALSEINKKKECFEISDSDIYACVVNAFSKCQVKFNL